MSKQIFVILFLNTISNLLCSAAGSNSKTLPNKYFVDKIVISFKLRKNESCMFQYNGAFFNDQHLNFNNNTNKDTVIVKSINSATSVSWSYGFYRPVEDGSLQLNQYVFLAKPGDTLHLSYYKAPLLNISACKSNLIASGDSSFYADGKFIPANIVNPNREDSWKFFYTYLNKNLNKKYDKEILRINNLLLTAYIDSTTFNQYVFSCKVHYYKKILDWVWQNDGKYFKPAVSVIAKNIENIEQLLKCEYSFISRDLPDVIDGYVRVKIIKRGGNFTDGVNVYNEAAKAELGKFKAAYLTVCILKNPVKFGNGFESTLNDFKKRYKNDQAYLSYVHNNLTHLLKSIYIPTQNRLLGFSGTASSIGDVLK